MINLIYKTSSLPHDVLLESILKKKTKSLNKSQVRFYIASETLVFEVVIRIQPNVFIDKYT